MKTVADIRAYLGRRIDMVGVQVTNVGKKYSIYFKPLDVNEYEITTDVTGMSDAQIKTELTRISDVASTNISAMKGAGPPAKAFGSYFFPGSNRQARRTL